MDRAYSKTLGGRPIGAAMAAKLLADGTITNRHDFLCADESCRLRNVPVLLALPKADGSFPHFRTCTSHECLDRMGRHALTVAGEYKNAEALHEDCEAFQSAQSGAPRDVKTRIINGFQVTLLSGTPLSMSGDARAESVRKASVAGDPSDKVETVRQNAHLYSLIDSLPLWAESSLPLRTVILQREQRSLSDLFIRASALNLRPSGGDGQPIYRRQSGEALDYAMNYVYFGRAQVQVKNDRSIRFAFDDGGRPYADPSTARSPEPKAQLVTYLNPQMLDASKNKRMIERDLESFGITLERSGYCLAFVLGHCRIPQSKYFLNVDPLNSAEDVVVLPLDAFPNFMHLVRYLGAAAFVSQERQAGASSEPRRHAPRAAGVNDDDQTHMLAMEARRKRIEQACDRRLEALESERAARGLRPVEKMKPSTTKAPPIQSEAPTNLAAPRNGLWPSFMRRLQRFFSAGAERDGE